jgi:hypothetical protein
MAGSIRWCTYCKDVHDDRLACPAYMRSRNMSHEYSNPICPECKADMRVGPHKSHCGQIPELNEFLARIPGRYIDPPVDGLSDAEIAEITGAFEAVMKPQPTIERDGNGPASATSKPSNPKQGLGVLKFAMSLVSFPVLANLSLAMLEGALKYGRHNYRMAGVKASVYVDATLRHIFAFWEGQDLDPDSKIGLHHLDKAIASLVVMRDAMILGKFNDDRPPKHDPKWIEDVNAKVKKLLEAFPHPVEPFTQLGDRTLAVDPKVAG